MNYNAQITIFICIDDLFWFTQTTPVRRVSNRPTTQTTTAGVQDTTKSSLPSGIEIVRPPRTFANHWLRLGQFPAVFVIVSRSLRQGFMRSRQSPLALLEC